MPSLSMAYQWAIDVCNQANVGYSQAYRNEQTIDGIVYYDCSSFIWYALMAGGWDVVGENGGSTWPFTTTTMRTQLLRHGFKRVSTAQPWQAGDVLWRTGHTEMAYSSVRTMGAHTSKRPLEDQVSINATSSTAKSWEELYRYAPGSPVDPDDPLPPDPEDPDNPPPPGPTWYRPNKSSVIPAILGAYLRYLP